ncbi:hypothetical protein [Arenicella xantha]|uniref:Uncharacterized protein n=1 Tax=Arenicella xantha TaxID=644221 RepID=A0A395JIS5_9GAMM|nr:hypothetical protein [Arenicella xantha]RBP48688.1 hypothetical protein DFR28_10526 [Arenicella xantha]
MIFKQVFRIAFVTLIWKQYKHIIVSTFLLFAYLFLVSSIHSDFLTHTVLKEDKSGSGLSFVYKWLAFAAGIGAYFFYHSLRSRLTKQTKPPAAVKETSVNAPTVDPDDPFNAIRARKKLRSRADFLDGKD